MESWDLLQRIVILLGVALVFGIVARRLKQNAVVGYLVAGVVIGPTILAVVGSSDEIRDLSELGVALLLFSIGLEFSFARLRQIGRVATVGGTLQLTLTIAVITGVFLAAGFETAEAVVIGFAISMSSTAVVLRVLADRAEMDSLHGRNSVGILLLQDLAVVPLLLMTQALAERQGGYTALLKFGGNIAAALALTVAMVVITRHLMPGLLTRAASSGSRELSVVLAVTASLGAAWSSHALGLSPVLGAFLAGILLAESPFAEQIRADITPLGAVFITIFFASIGTMAELPGGLRLFIIALSAFGILVAKAFIVGLIVWIFQHSLRTAIATGLALSQVGEFTFVLADVGMRAGILRAETFQMLLGASVMTLILTPYLIASAPRISTALLRRLSPIQRRKFEEPRVKFPKNRVIVIGYGPAGQEIVKRLQLEAIQFLVLELNPITVTTYRSAIPIEFGDASQPEILHHIGVAQARAVVVTVSDANMARLTVNQIRRIAPHVPLIVRARYHMFSEDLRRAGADTLVNEEQLVGREMAEATVAQFNSEERASAQGPA
ncbi:MAG: cation:proton antiporter [Bryobacteraceae bacterium]